MSLSLILSRCAWFVIVPGATLSLAALAPPGDSSKQPVSGEQAAAAPSADNTDRKYCTMQQATGSRMPRKVCKTKEEWARAGVDIDKEMQAK